MGFLFGGNNSGLPAKDQLPLGQNPARSASHQEGRVLPLLYGRQRVGCQFISDAFDIRVESVSTGGKQNTRAGTNYYASFAVAVGHGPMTAFHDLYLNGDSVFSSTTKIYAAKLSQTANVATFQTPSAHHLASGQVVNVFNADQPEFNGQFTITVVSDTQFQYTIPGTSIPSETASPVSGKKIYCTVKLDPIYAAGADQTDITIPDFGTATIYWGTETQAADAYLSNTSGIQHPPYKGICYLVFHQLFLGFNQTNVQNVEAVMERIPTYDFLNPAQANLAGDCNPAFIFADLLLNPRCGLACDKNADVNTDSISEAAETFLEEANGFSPLYTRPEELRSLLVDFLSMVDAAPVLDSDGKLSLVVQRQSGIKTLYIRESHLVDLPSFDPADWSSVVNETYLNYTDRDAGWNGDFVAWKDNAAFFAKQRPEPQTLDKPFITQREIAAQICALAGALAALPQNSGQLKLAFDPDVFDLLAAGGSFHFDYAPRPVLSGIYRVVKRSLPDPAQPVITIEVVLDRSYLYTQTIIKQPAVVPPDGSVVPDPDPGAVAPVVAALVELPLALCPNSAPGLGVLVQRDVPGTQSAQLWLGRNYFFTGTAPESFLLLQPLAKFALHGRLTADYAAGTATITPDNAPPAEADDPLPLTEGLTLQLDGPELLLPDVCAFDALANATLLFVEGEIMSIAAANLTAAGAYTLTVIRGRFGTTITDHAAGADVWIIARSDLPVAQHPHFLAGNTARFKLFLDWQQAADVDAFDQSLAGDNW